MRRTLRQPWISGTLSALFVPVAALAFLADRRLTVMQTVLAVSLAVAGAAAFRFPVHVAAHIKLYLTAPALFIAAVVLPPPITAIATVVIAVAGNLLIRERTGLLAADILNEGLRWGIAGTLASLVYHALPQEWQPLPLVLAALIMYALDVLSIALIIASIDKRSLGSIARDALDNWRFEGAMYLMGALGALDAGYQPWALLLLVIPSALIYRAVQHSYELQGSTRRLIEGLADTVDIRDVYNTGHSKRVATNAQLMVDALKKSGRLGPLEGDLIVTAARVHDIGKIEIPDSILHRVSKLDDQETDVLRSHVDRGAEILQCYPNFRRGVPLVRHHHERWDGQGYPHRLAKHEIPLGARIVAIADGYDALTSERPYQPSLTADRAAAALRKGRGEQWDPELVDLFITCLGLASPSHLQIVRPQQDDSSETA